MSYKGRGYINQFYSAPKELFDYFWQLTSKLDLPGSPIEKRATRFKYHRFIAHLYISRVQFFTQSQDPTNEFVPIYCRLREAEFGRSMKPNQLKNLGIIKARSHDQLKGKSAEYRLVEKIFNKACVIEHRDTSSRWEALMHGNVETTAMVNLMNGRKINARRKHWFHLSETHRDDFNIPSLVKDAIRSLQPCPFNPWNAGLLGNRLEIIAKRVKSENYNKIRSRLMNLRICQKTILNQSPTLLPIRTSTNRHLYRYNAAYSVQLSGRVTEIGVGFQGASQVAKHLLLKDVPNIYNYDLKSAQANVLSGEFKACNIVCPWLDEYLADKNAKITYSTKLGISVDVWKKCFYALIMGAISENTHGSVYKSLLLYYNNDEIKAKKVLNLFTTITEPIKIAASMWRNYLFEQFDKRYHYKYKNMKFWHNACNMEYKNYGIKMLNNLPVLVDRNSGKIVKSAKKIESVKRKIAAFILQGKEACFVHNLTLICKKNNIPVYKNEHDGIITGKPIPDKLKYLAANKANLANCSIVIKELCSIEKLHNWENELDLKT